MPTKACNDLNSTVGFQISGLVLNDQAVKLNPVSLVDRVDECLIDAKVTRAIFESSLDAIALFNDSGQYVEANPAACQLFECSRADLLNLTIYGVESPTDPAEAEQMMRDFISKGSLAGEFELKVHGGSTRFVEFRAVASILPHLHLTIMRNVSARREAESRLARSQAMLEEAEHLAHLGSWHWDLGTGVLSWSAEIFRLIGLKPHVVEPDAEIFYAIVRSEERDKARQFIRDAIELRSTFDHHFVVNAYDGVERTLHSRGQVVTNGEGVPVRFFGTMQDVTEDKRSEVVQERLLKQLQTLSARVVEIQEVERRGIARELHDELGQSLTGLKFMIETSRHARCSSSSSSPDSNCADMLSLVDDLIARVREMSLKLRPAMLDDLGLLPTLLWHFERYSAQTGVKVDFRHAGLERRLPPSIDTAAYRIVQEALTNVARHARVDSVRVRLWVDEQELFLEVEDDGVGVEPEKLVSWTSCGLTGMRERVLLLQGNLVIDSSPKMGTQILARLPFSKLGNTTNK